MDIYCPKCGEPVDLLYLHDVAEEKNTDYTTVLHEFQSTGCIAIGALCSKPTDDEADRAYVMAAMFDLLGDDVDGAAAMMEDFGF